jgi:hypothetical protein
MFVKDIIAAITSADFGERNLLLSSTAEKQIPRFSTPVRAKKGAGDHNSRTFVTLLCETQ